MTISKKLRAIILSIVFAVVIQSIIGLVLIQYIHGLSQSANEANDYLAQLDTTQDSVYSLLSGIDTNAQTTAAIGNEYQRLAREIRDDITELHSVHIQRQQKELLKPAEEEELAIARVLSGQLRDLTRDDVAPGIRSAVKADLIRLIKINRQSASIASSFIKQQSELANRLLVYFRLLVFLVCSFVVYGAFILVFYVTRDISSNIETLISATERIAAGDLSEPVKVRSEDELEKLAESFNAMMNVLGMANEQALQLNRESHDRFIQTITAFVKAIEAKDVYTRGHSENVAYYATQICEAFDWPEEDIENIRIAALLHDIGKIGIKEEVLNKPSRLTDDEFVHIKQHPAISRKILGSFPSLQGLANVAIHHHERYDGRGYPDGLIGDEIPYGARILAIADSFDAMTSARPYKAAMPLELALSEIEKHSGTQFDPLLAMVFIDLVRQGKITLSELQEEAS